MGGSHNAISYNKFTLSDLKIFFKYAKSWYIMEFVIVSNFIPAKGPVVR